MTDARASVLQVLDRYKAAVRAKDVAAFVSIYAETVRVFDMWGEWSLRGRAAWGKMAAEWFGSLGTESVVVDFEDVEASVSGEMACLSAFAKYTAVSESGEVLRYLHNRFTAVLEKRNGAWTIVHEHTSGPADHSTLKISLRR